jgi:hypothetical protein
LLAALVAFPSIAQTSAPAHPLDNPDWLVSHVVPAGGDYAGQPLGAYTAAWWQWAFSMPKEDSPMRETTGKNCALNQTGDVWFLAGAYGGGKVRRSCTVPQGKALFFPVINTMFYCAGATPAAATNNQHLAYAQATLNGVEIPGVEAHRERSPGCFRLPYEGNAKAHGSIGYPAATDGYWLMLRPLPAGEYLLKFRAKYDQPDEPFGNMAQDIEYRILIQAP